MKTLTPVTNKVDAAVVLKAVEKEAAPLLAKLQRVKDITNVTEYAKAMEIMKELKALLKVTEEKEDSLVKPLQEVVKGIKNLFKPFSQSVLSLQMDIKSKMQMFVAANEAKERKLEADFESGKIKKVSTFVSKAADLTIVNSGVRKIWKAVCVDESKTPRAFLVPNEVAIREELKAGKKVEGWDWVQVDSIAI